LPVLFQPIQSFLKVTEGTENCALLVTFLLNYDYNFYWNKNFHYTGIFEGNTFISINILSQLIVTITSSVRILYHAGCGNFYSTDGQDWLQFALKFTTSLHQTSFYTDLIILYPKIFITPHFLNMFILYILNWNYNDL
jgi:hypothetical protein